MPRKQAHPPVVAPMYRNRVVALRYLKPRDIADHPHQWRLHPEIQKAALEGVLKEIGIAGVLLVYASSQHSGQITAIDGHLRKSLDPNQPWPCVVLDVDDAESAYLLSTHDPLSAMAEADREQLATLLAEVQSGDNAVQQMLAQLAEQEGIVPAGPGTAPLADQELPTDRLEEILERWQVQPDDLWHCGQHRILCADCREPATLVRLLGDRVPAMIFADPPYGISIVATNGYVGCGEACDIPFGGMKHLRQRIHVGGGQRHKDQTGHYPIETWQKPTRGTDGAAKPFGSKTVRGSVGTSHVVAVGKYAPVLGDETIETAVTAAALCLSTYPNAVQIWWGGNYYAHTLPPSSCWLVWDKETTGNFADCELAWTNQPKASRLFRHRWNGMLRESERERRWHPTQKPAALAVWVYETLGVVGDVVLDPFLGSGPTLIAGEQRGRQVYGCELSPEYVAITLERYFLLTGDQPVRIP